MIDTVTMFAPTSTCPKCSHVVACHLHPRTMDEAVLLIEHLGSRVNHLALTRKEHEKKAELDEELLKRVKFNPDLYYDQDRKIREQNRKIENLKEHIMNLHNRIFIQAGRIR